MRLRNLFMILLLCMTVGVFSACTGDDGETGPQGPQGPQGEPGAATDAEPETSFYPFLKSWGSENGEVACGDDLLEGSGPLPGGDDALNHKLAAPSPAPQVNNNPTIVKCGNGFFSQISVADVNTLGDLNLATDPAAFTSDTGIVFVPTGKGSAKDAMNVPSTEFNPAIAVTTTKTFIGGMVFADLNTGGDVNEPGERQDLYSQCGVGTAPSYVMGTYRAVRIEQSTQPYKDGAPVRNAANELVPGPKTTTTKLCVVLDAHPGATKCLVDVVTVPADTEKDGRSIAVYDGMNLDTVVPMDELYNAGSGSEVDVDFFMAPNDDANDFYSIENICSLFGEGGTAE